MERTDITNDAPDRWSKLQAESARRLALLRLANEDRVITGNRCPICKKLPEMVAIVKAEYKYKDNHEAGCELAEEMK